MALKQTSVRLRAHQVEHIEEMVESDDSKWTSKSEAARELVERGIQQDELNKEIDELKLKVEEKEQVIQNLSEAQIVFDTTQVETEETIQVKSIEGDVESDSEEEKSNNIGLLGSIKSFLGK